MEPLTEKEKHILALSLFAHAMKAGPSSFKEILDLATKLGLEGQLVYYAKDWIEFGASGAPPQPDTDP